MSLLTVWIIYTAVGLVGFGAVFVWAVRSGQFTELDRQRHMALDADHLPEPVDSKISVSRADAYAWKVLISIAFAAIAAALVIGAKGG